MTVPSRPLSDLDDVVALADAAAAGEDPDPLAVELRDGTTAHLRPIRPDDADRLRAGLRLLSPRSRYQRFLAPVDHLTEGQVRYLTEVDHRDHVAWVALDADAPDLPGIGVARYVRLRDEPTVAEAAVTVIDDYQGRGLGTLLLAVLARTALDRGIATFRNYVLPGNAELLELAEQLGAEVTDTGDGVWLVDVPLPEDADELPDTPAGEAIRAIGRSDLHRGRMATEIPPVWPPEETAEPEEEPAGGSDGPAGGEESPLLRRWLDEALDRPG